MLKVVTLANPNASSDNAAVKMTAFIILVS